MYARFNLFLTTKYLILYVHPGKKPRYFLNLFASSCILSWGLALTFSATPSLYTDGINQELVSVKRFHSCFSPQAFLEILS